MLSQDPRLREARTISEKIEQVRQAAGERFEDIELSTVATVIVTDDRREVAEQFARDRGWSDIAADEVLDMPSVFIGTVDHIVDEMQRRRERYGISYYVLPTRSWKAVRRL